MDYYNESLIVFCLLTCSLFGICLKLITLEIIILAKSLLFLIVDILTYIVLLHTEDDNRVKQTWFEVYFGITKPATNTTVKILSSS